MLAKDFPLRSSVIYVGCRQGCDCSQYDPKRKAELLDAWGDRKGSVATVVEHYDDTLRIQFDDESDIVHGISHHFIPFHRRVVCAANRKGGLIICGARHMDSLMRDMINRLNDRIIPPQWSSWEEGFVDQRGKFMTRREAWIVAEAAGQIRQLVGNQPTQSADQRELDSSNLY
jgi:hypothetical protein